MTTQRGVDSTIDAGDDGFRPVPADQPQAGASLGEIGRFFLAKPSPLIIATVAGASVLRRFRLGRFQAKELVIPAAIVALEPFTEWLIHVHVLHGRPRQIGPLTIDPRTARKHREHHRNPKDLRIVMVPFEALVPAVAIAALAHTKLPSRQASTAVAAGFATLGWYEWVHYLIHSPYRPKSQWFRTLSRNHRLHHFKNEHYWFGVTRTRGDAVLGTKPDPATVDVSPTVRTLGIDAGV